MNAFVENLTDDEIKDLKQSEDVAVVEPDYVFHAHAVEVQRNAPWNLVHLSKDFSSRTEIRDFSYDSNDGAGVTVYVLDSGVNPNAVNLRGRVELGANFIEDEGHEDLFGHGTEVATILAGNVYGVARAARVVSVKVLDKEGFGSNSIVAEAVNWVLADHKSRVAGANGRFVKSIINLSLGGPKSEFANMAIQKAIDAGIQVFTSSGNDYGDACEHSPASVPDAITVGAVDRNNRMSDFSNWGKCVDLLAPGQDVLTAGSEKMSTVSGTRYFFPSFLIWLTNIVATLRLTLLASLPPCYQDHRFIVLKILSSWDLPSSIRRWNSWSDFQTHHQATVLPTCFSI